VSGADGAPRTTATEPDRGAATGPDGSSTGTVAGRPASPRFDPEPLLAAGTATRLAEHLAALDYTVDGVADRLGPVGSAALARGWTAAAHRAAVGPSADGASTLIRLWPLQEVLDLADVRAALGDLVEPLTAAGVLRVAGSAVRAGVDIRPYGDEDTDQLVVCDLVHTLDGATTAVPADHVPGVGGASTTLAQLTPRGRVGRALDLGTGNGVQSLSLTAHAGHVVATDTSRRALDMARLTVALSGVADRVELRAGSLLEPVAGERFDLVVSNPPFVVTPLAGRGEQPWERFDYRDSGLSGDDLGRTLVGGLPDHLAAGGTAVLLANWVHRRGRDWQGRLAGWLEPALTAGCDAWVVQREVADPAAYSETWLRDAALDRGPDGAARAAAWLGAFDDAGIEGVGFGWVVLRAAGREPGTGSVRIEDWAHPVSWPLGDTVAAWAVAADALTGRSDSELAALRPRVAPGVDEERYGAPGAEEPRVIVLRQHTGLMRARAVDTATAGLVGACDGQLTVAAIAAALADLLGEDPAALRRGVLAATRELLAEHFLLPS